MTTKQEIEKAREKSCDDIAFESSKYSGYPEHFKTACAGFDAGLKYALNLPEVIEMYEVAKHEGVDTEFDKLLKEIGE